MDERKEMTDEQLASLLDEALAPAELSPALTERIIAAARPAPARDAVAARIGSGWTALAAAAMIALVMLGAWALFEPRPAPEPTGVTSLAALERELSALEAAAVAEPAHLEEQIELLEFQLELAGTEPAWPGADPLAEASAEAQLDRFVSEPMWQF
ncbi:MAG: hypothetical protein ACODAQ_07335 [Phycisphaeraceae bacterium]